MRISVYTEQREKNLIFVFACKIVEIEEKTKNTCVTEISGKIQNICNYVFVWLRIIFVNIKYIVT